MAKISELKERARAFEKEGEREQALQVYQHILKHLEGSPAIKRELPMYVKVGDLQIGLDDKAGALASYEKAAGLYAKYGSAKSVLALAGKVLRVDPMKADFHLVYTRALIEHGHVAAARDVLADYADRSGLGQTQAALQALEGLDDEGAKPLLEMILDSAEQGGRSGTEEVAKRVSVQLGGAVTFDDLPGSEEQEEQEEQEEEEEGEEEEEEEEEEEPEPSPLPLPDAVIKTVEQASAIEARSLDLSEEPPDSDKDLLIQHGAPPPLDEGPAPPQPIVPPEPLPLEPMVPPEPIVPERAAPPPEPEPVVSGQRKSMPGDMTFEADATGFTAAAPAPKKTPPSRPHVSKPRRGVRIQRPTKKGTPAWVWGGAIVLVLVIGGAVAFVMMRGGGETAPTISPATVDTTPPGEPTTVAAVDTSALVPTVDSALLAATRVEDSLAALDSALLEAFLAGSDTGDSDTNIPATDTPSGPVVVAPAPATAGPAYVLDGSTVEDVVQYSRQGRSGWRSIQTLSTGERMTVETTMASVNDPNEVTQGATNVTSGVNGSVGVTRIDNLIVTVTGSVSEAVMRDLLTLLVEHTR